MGLPLLCTTNARANGCAAHGGNLCMLNSFPSVDLEHSLHSCHHHILLPDKRSKDFDDHKRIMKLRRLGYLSQWADDLLWYQWPLE